MTTVAGRGDGSGESSPETRSPELGFSEPPLPYPQASHVDDAPVRTVGERPGTTGPSEWTIFEATEALPRALKILGSVVAPTSLLTGLLFYFGRLHAIAFCQYLSVQFTVLDLTYQDYLIQGVEGLIPPLIVVAGAGLVVIWVHRLQLEPPSDRARSHMLRLLMPSAAVAGLVLVSLAVADLIGDRLFMAFPEARGLSFSIGVLLLAYAARSLRLLVTERRPGRAPRRAPVVGVVAEWSAVFILVSVGLFWAVGSYAIANGRGLAHQIETSLLRFPDIAVYSEKRLSLQAPDVQEVPCQPDGAYRFRYEGLKLVMQSGNQYLFLPAHWTQQNGTAILLPRADALRLEFSPPGQVRNAIC